MVVNYFNTSKAETEAKQCDTQCTRKEREAHLLNHGESERARERESERLVPSSVLSMVYPKNNNEREIDNFCVLYTVPVFLDRYMKCLIYLA